MKRLQLTDKQWWFFGFAAMVVLHLSAIPSIIRIIYQDYSNLPPLDYILLVFIGLTGMTIRYAYYVKDKIATISNIIGVALNFIILLTVILIRI